MNKAIINLFLPYLYPVFLIRSTIGGWDMKNTFSHQGGSISDRFWSAILINRLLATAGSLINDEAKSSVVASRFLEYQRLGTSIARENDQKHNPIIEIPPTSPITGEYPKIVARGENSK